MSTELTAHLAECPACRAHAASMEGIARCLADMRAFAAAIPAEVLEENKRRILAAIADKNAKPARRFARRTPATSRQQSAKDFASPRIHPVLLWSAAGIAATLVMIFGIFFRDRTPTTSTPEPAVPAAPVVATHSPAKIMPPVTISSTNQERRTKNQELPVTLAWLQQEFARLKVAREGVTWDYLNKVVRFLTTGQRTLDEKVDGWQLLADAYETAGEADRARNAFGRYLDFVEKKDGKEKAAMFARIKGDGLSFAKKDRFAGLAYYDMVITRYPNTDAADHAVYMSSYYYEGQKQYDTAIAQLDRLVETRPDAYWAKQAVRRIPILLFNAKRPAEARQRLMSLADQAPMSERADIHFQLGMMSFVHGPKEYSVAAQDFQWVVANCPEQKEAVAARRMLAEINNHLLAPSGI
jgi:tetratricopeptide (TPR) repeat protein